MQKSLDVETTIYTYIFSALSIGSVIHISMISYYLKY